MSFEKHDINRERSERDEKIKEREKEKTNAFLLEKKIFRESSDLLSKLAKEISEEFGIDILKAKEVISGKSLSSLDQLKSELSGSENIDYEKLFGAIEGAKNQIEEMSKRLREELKKSVDEEESIMPETFHRPITDMFISQELREKAQRAQNLSDQLIGAPIGLIDSTEAVILFTYSLGKGIILTPYHIYLMLIGEAEFPYKNI